MLIDFNKYPLPKRMRHHTASNLYFPAHELKTLPEYYPPLYENIDWKENFKNGLRPDVLDIGCGKGALLFDFAEQNIGKNILGIEVRKNAVDWINQIIKAYEINNASALWYSVVNGINFIENESVEKVLYLFPDPWPKKKHLKRRAFNPFTLNEILRVLKTGGKLYLATDLAEVHEYHKEITNNNELLSVIEISDDSNWDLPETNKQKFCLRENIKFYRLICEKKQV